MHDQYSERLRQRQQAAEKHEQLFRTIGNARLVTGLVFVALLFWNPWLLPVPVAVFVGLIVWHERITRSADAEKRAARFYETGLRRLEGQWAGSGEAGERFRDPNHPYADDLDIFGRGSVFQRVNAARTASGEQILAGWLKAPASRDEVIARQQAVSELSSRLDLREDLALLGEDVRAGLHAAPLLDWGSMPPEPGVTGRRAVALVLSAGVLICFSLWMLQRLPLWPLLLFLLGELIFYSSVRPAVHRVLGAMEMPARDLGVLAGLAARLEREQFQSPLLNRLMKDLATEGIPASKQIAKLRRLVEFRDQSRNQMYAIIAEPLLWSTHFAFAIERWRQHSGPHLGEWLHAIGEFEALSSLAGYASENPHDPMPELVAEGPLFEGRGIAHPLLPGKAVRNDVHLGRDMRLLVISGSNMSGKSTLLRSVGLNTVLAWAGAPVRAHGLRVSPLAVGASMRVQDSLLDGKSRFYAEITRLRQVVDMAGREVPLLFLLDELLSGTNSHDRVIGSEAVVRNLVRQGALGLVTTHDLALARIAEELAPAAANVHFEDHIENGRIAFDYTMRPGVVRKSNALELMRSVGLEV